MNEKLIVIYYLLGEIKKELELLKEYNADLEKARKLAIKNGGSTWDYMEFEGRLPSKLRIYEDGKKIRQLVLEISKETEDNYE
jgi:hypothetical protein